MTSRGFVLALVLAAGCGGAPRPAPADPAPATPPPPTPSAPALAVLAGTRVEAPTVSAAFVRPEGWLDQANAMTDGEPMHVLLPQDPALAEAGVVMVLYRPVPEADRAAGFDKVLEAGTRATLRGLEPTFVLGPETFERGGQRGGRAIARASRDGTEVELYIAGIMRGERGHVIVALYTPEHAAAFRPVTETVLATLELLPAR